MLNFVIVLHSYAQPHTAVQGVCAKKQKQVNLKTSNVACKGII